MSNLIPVNSRALKTVNDEMITSLDDAIRIGDIVAKSRMFPDVTDQAKAVVAILAGRELGIPPMASLRGIHVIKGKVEIGAGLLAAMIKRSGKYKYTIAASDDTVCQLDWYEEGRHLGGSRFTIADAKRAKLIKPDSNWEKFPRAMLFARALTEGQRKYCPEIAIGAAYAPGEIAADDDVIEIPQTLPRPVEIDSAIGGIHDRIGQMLAAAGHEDSSGARRFHLEWFQRGAFQNFAELVRRPVEEIIGEFGHLAGLQIPTAEEIFNAPRPAPAPLPAAWTRDTIAREIADQQVANTVAKELETISNQIKAEKKEFEHPRDVLQSIADEAPAPDPVPALKPTLTQAQQKVSDAVMSAWREHKKDKGTVLHLIGQYLQREVKRSSDLTDPEAEKVFSYLQGCMAQWSDEAKSEPIRYDQKNRAHSAELAAELDSLIKKLTILGVKASDLSNGIASVVMVISGRGIPNRYHLTDEEARHVIEYLREDLEKKECERAMATDEI